MLIVHCISPSAAAALPFSDVSESAWYHASVKLAYESGLMLGTEGTSFSPGDALTVAQAVTLAARTHNACNKGGALLEQGEPWYGGYVGYALENGIIGADEFNDYTRDATRAEAAHIFANIFPDGAPEKINYIGYIPDVNENDRYGSDIYALYSAGILNGADSAGAFLPDVAFTRAEAAAIVTRILFEELRISFSPGAQEVGLPTPGIVQQETQSNSTKLPMICPVQGGHVLTQGFTSGHGGLDISYNGTDRGHVPAGTTRSIIAAEAGTVVKVINNCPHTHDSSCTCNKGTGFGGFGNCVVTRHENGLMTVYAHLMQNSIVVKEGQSVARGGYLAMMGNSGSAAGATGIHLHFEVCTSNYPAESFTCRTRCDPDNYMSCDHW